MDTNDFKKITGYDLGIKDGKPYFGGSLYLRGTGITSTENVNHTLSPEARKRISERSNMVPTWEWNGRTYIKVDGIFSIVRSHHGNVWKVCKIGRSEFFYIVTDGEGHYAHGKNM